MKYRLWLKLVLSICLTVLFLLALETTYGFFLMQNKNIKTSYVLTEKVNADLIIHGPCEPYWMVNPLQIDSLTNIPSYNLALSHSDFADNLLHLHAYLKNNKAPRYLLLYVTPESFDNRFNTFNTYRFTHLMDDTLVNNVVKRKDTSFYRWHKIPFVRYGYYNNFINFKMIQGAKHYFTNRKKPFHPSGYQPPTVQTWHYQLEDFIELYPDSVRFEWSDQRAEDFYQLIDFAKSKEIEVVLYESPVFEPTIAFQLNRQEFLNKIRNAAKIKGIDFWVFEGLEMAKEPSHFFSTLNTTKKGSLVFNEILAKKIRDELVE